MFSAHESAYSLEYYLSQVVPKGGIVCAVYPKRLLASLLPKIAKEKNARIVVVGRTEYCVPLFRSGRVIAEEVIPDVVLGEPEAFSPEGALVLPQETQEWRAQQVIAVGRHYQWAQGQSAHVDAVLVSKVVSEFGVLPFEAFAEKVASLQRE